MRDGDATPRGLLLVRGALAVSRQERAESGKRERWCLVSQHIGYASRGLMVLVLAFGVVLVGPSGRAMAFTMPPPITLPGSMLGSLGATSATIGSAAATASSTGAGMTVTMGGTALGGTAAASAAANPAALAVGAALLGWSVGRFFGDTACGAGVELVCWPTKPEYVPNSDVEAPTSPGWVGGMPVEVNRQNAPGVTDTLTVGFTVGEPVFQQTTNGSFTLSVPQDLSAPSSGLDVGFEIHCRNTSTGVVGLWSSGSKSFSPYNPAPQASQALTCGSGTGFDHLLIKYPQNETQANTPNPANYTGLTTFYPEGHTARPATASQNPDRTWLTKAQCVKDAAVQFVEAASVVWTEADTVVPKYPDVECPAGFGMKRLEVHKITPSFAAPGNDLVVWEWVYPVEADGLHPAEKWTECASGTCVLRLWRLTPERLSCFENPDVCRDWWPDRLASPAKYECVYGTNVVALTECYVYRPTFTPAAADKTGPEYANPDGTLPAGEPGTATDTSTEDCPPGLDYGFSLFKPWWYWKSLTCALSWAFVPADGFLGTKGQEVRTAWADTPVDQVWTSANGVVGAFGKLDDGAGLCGGFEVPWDTVLRAGPDAVGGRAQSSGLGQYQPFSACAEPNATFAQWTRLLSVVVGWFGALFAGLSTLGRAFGMEMPWDGSELDAS